MNELNSNGSQPLPPPLLLGVTVLVVVGLYWWARRSSLKAIMLAQAAVSVAQAVVIVLFVMRERIWQQQENLQKSPMPELKGSASNNSAVASQQTKSEISDFQPPSAPSYLPTQFWRQSWPLASRPLPPDANLCLRSTMLSQSPAAPSLINAVPSPSGH